MSERMWETGESCFKSLGHTRAIVWKLHVNLHVDEQDAGPTATFPVGDFEGGYLELPQLEARFK